MLILFQPMIFAPTTTPISCATNLVIEDIPSIGSDTAAQEQLFHLHNLFAAEKKFLLLTGRGTPLHWNMTLPDLASRLQGARNAALNQPDDLLFSALLAKLFCRSSSLSST